MIMSKFIALEIEDCLALLSLGWKFTEVNRR